MITNNTGRRLCLRIEGFPTEEDETSSNVLEKVKALIENANIEEKNIDIPKSVIDRAHCIGPIISKEGKHPMQSVIVKFSIYILSDTNLYFTKQEIP